MIQFALVFLGLGVSAITLGAILWSIAFPHRRLWPPKQYTAVTPFLVWVPTFLLFGILIILGLLGWGTLDLPNWLRFGIGIPLILIGNAVVWTEVAQFGIPQTGGAKGRLRTVGMYRYSRNPQYMADIAIVSGWIAISSASLAPIVGAAAILILITTPFAEEPWLEEIYGQSYRDYLTDARRYF